MEMTIENHLRYLRDFFVWIGGVYPQLRVATLTEAKLLEYAAVLRTRSAKPKFLRDNILGLRRFFAWLVYCKKMAKHGHYTRPVCEKTILQRIYKATLAATGVCITPKVLRQTCGHLYSQDGDGSLLSRLGWSPAFAFHYTWLPRMIDAGSALPKYLRKPHTDIS